MSKQVLVRAVEGTSEAVAREFKQLIDAGYDVQAVGVNAGVLLIGVKPETESKGVRDKYDGESTHARSTGERRR